MKRYVDSAIILSRRDYSERDRIVVLLAKEHGKISVIAKGTRVAKSKLAAGIELFSESEVSIISGKSSLHTLVSSRLIKHYGKISQDIDRTMLAYDFLKVINKIVEDGSGQEYYDTLLVALKSLDNSAQDTVAIRLWFELQILKHSGGSPELANGSSSAKLEQAQNYRFNYDKQCFEPDKSGSFMTNHIKLLRLSESAPKPPQVAGSDETIKAAGHLVHNLLVMNVLE